MVPNDIQHDPDILFMAGLDEVLEVLGRTKLRVDLIEVFGCISVVAPIVVLRNRGDPNGVEAQILDIIKVFFDSLEVPAAVVA